MNHNNYTFTQPNLAKMDRCNSTDDANTFHDTSTSESKLLQTPNSNSVSTTFKNSIAQVNGISRIERSNQSNDKSRDHPTMSHHYIPNVLSNPLHHELNSASAPYHYTPDCESKSQSQQCPPSPSSGTQTFDPTSKTRQNWKMTQLVMVAVLCLVGVVVVSGVVWVVVSSTNELREMQDRVNHMEETITTLVDEVEELDEWMRRMYDVEDEEDDGEAPPRVRREVLRRESRVPHREVAVYDKPYGINLKEGEGLQLYSSLQEVSVPAAPQPDESAEVVPRPRYTPRPGSRRRQMHGSKLGKRFGRKRPQLKSLARPRPRPRSNPLGGLVKNNDVIYRDSLVKDTSVKGGTVSRVQQGPAGGRRAPTPTSTPPRTTIIVQPKPVIVTQERRRKRPRKKTTRRRRRSAALTAAHFTALPKAATEDWAGTGIGGVWQGADWVEGMGLDTRYKTQGDHVQVADPGIYLIYAQVKYRGGPLTGTGFEVKVNGRQEGRCSLSAPAAAPASASASCHTSLVTYLPKNSVVRVENNSPLSPVLELGDGEEASLGLVKLFDAPDAFHHLFSG